MIYYGESYIIHIYTICRNLKIHYKNATDSTKSTCTPNMRICAHLFPTTGAEAEGCVGVVAGLVGRDDEAMCICGP